MKALANLLIAIALISIIERFGVQGSAMRGGARGLQGDEVPEEVPQQFHQRARRATADELPDEVPQDVPQEFRQKSRRAAENPLDDEPEEVPQELENNLRFRRSSRKLTDDVPEEAPEAMPDTRRRRSPQLPIPEGLPPMPPMPPMPVPLTFIESPNTRVRRHLAPLGLPKNILTPY